jgi:hypothetical protein
MTDHFLSGISSRVETIRQSASPNDETGYRRYEGAASGGGAGRPLGQALVDRRGGAFRNAREHDRARRLAGAGRYGNLALFRTSGNHVGLPGFEPMTAKLLSPSTLGFGTLTLNALPIVDQGRPSSLGALALPQSPDTEVPVVRVRSRATKAGFPFAISGGLKAVPRSHKERGQLGPQSNWQTSGSARWSNLRQERGLNLDRLSRGQSLAPCRPCP